MKMKVFFAAASVLFSLAMVTSCGNKKAAPVEEGVEVEAAVQPVEEKTCKMDSCVNDCQKDSCTCGEACQGKVAEVVETATAE